MKSRISLDLNHPEQAVLVGKALSSPIRLEIMKTLVECPMNISELAERCSLPLSSTALHVRVLEEAGLIMILEKPGIRGSQKLCSLSFEDIYFSPSLHTRRQQRNRKVRFPMPIGNYFDCAVQAPCGIATEKKQIGVDDVKSGFYSMERTAAQLIWFRSGYVEYRFHSRFFRTGRLLDLKFSFEICSEAPGYNMDWPSDITVWVNKKEIGTLFCTGDFGDRRGTHTPDWWDDRSTQYGELRSVTVSQDGCFVDKIKSCGETLDSLGILEGDYLSFQIGVKPDAVHVGGINLFGERFGDYRQGIVMSATFQAE